MFFTSDLFIDAIIVLINTQTKNVRKIVEDFLIVCEEELRTGINMNDDYIRFYISLLKDLLENEYSLLNQHELECALLKFQSNPTAMQHRDIYDTLMRIFTTKERLTEERIKDITNRLRQHVLWYNCSRSTKKLFSGLAKFTSTIDRAKQTSILDDLKRMASELNDVFQSPEYNDMEASAIDRVDFGNIETIRAALLQHKQRNVDNVMKFGLQGMNRMFGRAQGYTLSESVVFNALSHHYKSRMLMNVARWTVQYNTPTNMVGGIPTVLFISLENETANNMMTLFKDAYASVMQTSPEGKTDEEIIEFVYDFFNRNGWRLIVERRLGNTFGFNELRSLVEEYEGMGHKICVTVIDYMNMMKKVGGDVGNHLQIRELYTNTVNFLKHKGSALFTAHQLNRDAAKLAATNVTNVVGKFGMGYLADGMDPQREVDVVVFLHIEKNQFGIPYLTMRIDKHRYVDDTEEKNKTCAYRFGPYGIQDDLFGKDESVRDIYSDKYAPVKGPLLTEADIPAVTEPPLQLGEDVFFSDAA